MTTFAPKTLKTFSDAKKRLPQQAFDLIYLVIEITIKKITPTRLKVRGYFFDFNLLAQPSQVLPFSILILSQRIYFVKYFQKKLKNLKIFLDIVHYMCYNIITGQGGEENKPE